MIWRVAAISPTCSVCKQNCPHYILNYKLIRPLNYIVISDPTVKRTAMTLHLQISKLSVSLSSGFWKLTKAAQT